MHLRTIFIDSKTIHVSHSVNVFCLLSMSFIYFHKKKQSKLMSVNEQQNSAAHRCKKILQLSLLEKWQNTETRYLQQYFTKCLEKPGYQEIVYSNGFFMLFVQPTNRQCAEMSLFMNLTCGIKWPLASSFRRKTLVPQYIYQDSKFIESVVSSTHCNPLQANYRVELLHREIPVVITGNGFAVYPQSRTTQPNQNKRYLISNDIVT